MLEAVEDFLTPITDDFAEPDAAVHRDEQGAFVQAGGLSVGDDGGVNEVVPDLEDFGFGLAAVNAPLAQNRREKIAGLFCAERTGFFERGEVDSAPLSECLLLRIRARRAELEISVWFRNE